MNFLDILTGSKKTSAKEIAETIIELEVKRDALISQAEPFKKQLNELLKKDLAGLDVTKSLKEKRAELAELTQKIETCDESIIELRQRLLERLHADRTERLNQIEKEIESIKEEKKKWNREWITAYARFQVVCNFFKPGATMVSLHDLNPEDRDFFNAQIEHFKADLNLEGNSIPSRINVLFHEKQQLNIQPIDEENVNTLIEEVRDRSAA